MKKISFLLSLLFISLSFAQDSGSLYSIILENEGYCVEDYFDGKTYLNSQRLTLKEGKLLLDLNGTESIFIPVLYSDSRGSYVTSEIDSFKLVEYIRCPVCHQWYISWFEHKCPRKKTKE
jgi:hypothetical protein